MALLRDPRIAPKHEMEEFALSQEQVTAIADASRAIRVTPNGGSFEMFEWTDGWSTKLTLDACDSSVVLKWFRNPPPEWIGVGALCDKIRRTLFDLQRQ